MKRTLLALTLGGLLSSTGALASNVEVYGVLDYGLTWQQNDAVDGTSESSLKMLSGQYIGSRVGIKGSEDLGNGLKVGFVLENGFATDTGALGQGDRLFGRDARVYLDGRFGYLSFGRMGSLVGGNGPYARFGHVVSPFSCGWGDLGGHLQVVSLGYEFIDNAIGYTTPKFGNVDATVQYSFGTDVNANGDGTEGKSSVDRLLSGAVRFQNDALMVTAGIETINHAQPSAGEANLDDAVSYNLGANYNTGWAKFFFYTQIFENYTAAAKTTTFSDAGGVDGFGINVGIEFPALNGTVKAGFGYGDFEASRDAKLTMDTCQTTVGYLYSLSKLTTLYTAANWIHSDYSDAYAEAHPSAAENVYAVTFGIVKKF